eukprot:TRINITY_DN5000_c0_g1_i2.p1 TRINITY_DN5000_c0_g1~~TRINITY_DN5000_c0_g1_i2.p1  ORF type:complete len:401 (-),score=99.53 TRINITY_DN5000_c0_g1_i2:39-1241(-)
MSGVNYTRVWEVHSMLHPKPDDFISTARFYVREGELQVWDEKRKKKKKRYFFLFNDILLLTKQESSKKFWLRIHITLRSPYVSVEDVPTSFNEFRLHCRVRTFALFCYEGELKRDWVEDIQKSISGQHKEELDNKKLQEITRSLNSDADLVKETELDEETKKAKENRKKAKAKEKDLDNSKEEDHDKPEESTKKKRPPKKATSTKPANNAVKPFDPFSLAPPGQNQTVHSSPGQFQNPFGQLPRANTNNSIPTFANSDIYGVSPRLTGSLVGTSSSMVPNFNFSTPHLPSMGPAPTGGAPNPFLNATPQPTPGGNPFAALGAHPGLAAPPFSPRLGGNPNINPFGPTGGNTNASYSIGGNLGGTSIPATSPRPQTQGYNPFAPSPFPPSQPSGTPNPFFN